MPRKKAETQVACMSCNRLGGKDRFIKGVPVVMCDECAPRKFRQLRVIGRLRKARGQ